MFKPIRIRCTILIPLIDRDASSSSAVLHSAKTQGGFALVGDVQKFELGREHISFYIL